MRKQSNSDRTSKHFELIHFLHNVCNWLNVMTFISTLLKLRTLTAPKQQWCDMHGDMFKHIAMVKVIKYKLTTKFLTQIYSLWTCILHIYNTVPSSKIFTMDMPILHIYNTVLSSKIFANGNIYWTSTTQC